MARVMGVWGAGGGFSLREDSARAPCTQDMLESLAEWFYATEYISSVPAVFLDLRRRIAVVYSN